MKCVLAKEHATTRWYHEKKMDHPNALDRERGDSRRHPVLFILAWCGIVSRRI